MHLWLLPGFNRARLQVQKGTDCKSAPAREEKDCISAPAGFNLNGTGAAINAFNSQDLVVRNNRFKGACNLGILIDGATHYIYGYEFPLEVYAKNALLLGNNFSGLNATTAAVVLGEKSMNCMVVGTGKEKVIDNGVGNKVTGMKVLPGGYHLGPLIRDNLHWRPGMWHH